MLQQLQNMNFSTLALVTGLVELYPFGNERNQKTIDPML